MAIALSDQKLLGSAAVLVVVDPLTNALLLTQRAAHLNSHRAEVALPGGKWEEGDSCLQATALRETEEEVGLAHGELQLIGDLPVSYTGAGVKVKPYVAELKVGACARVNSEELDAVFWMPEHILVEDARLRTDVFTLNGREFWSPAYRYHGFEIWGFTARVLVQYLSRYRKLELPQAHLAPVARHKPR